MVDRSDGFTRRSFFTRGVRAAAGIVADALGTTESAPAAVEAATVARPRFGILVSPWARDWDVPTLLRNAQRAGVQGIEMGVGEAHGVSPDLPDRQRQEIRLRFENSAVSLVGFGTRASLQHREPDRVSRAMDQLRAYLVLSHQLGAGGISVQMVEAEERTFEHVAASLDELGRFASDLGQEVRVLAPGGSDHLLLRRIVEAVQSPAVTLCWSWNREGKAPPDNIDIEKGWFGRTLRVGELDAADSRDQQLVDLLFTSRYDGWVLLEAHSEPRDRVQALVEQRAVFDRLVAHASARAQGS